MYSDKGDYENLKKSLEKMRDHAKKHNVKLIGTSESRSEIQPVKKVTFFTLSYF